MLKLLTDLPDHVIGVSAEGRVTGEDYRDMLEPAVDERLRLHSRIDLLYHLGADFTRFTTTALWDDARLGLHHLHDFRRVAVVTDVDWLKVAIRAAEKIADAELRVYPNAELASARAWLLHED
jgi:hypothetical protein